MGRGYILTLRLLVLCPAVPWAGPGTFEAILTKALELIFARRHARAAIPAGLALARGAVVALPHTLAAQEAVGEVQPLSVDRHLWVQGHQETHGSVEAQVCQQSEHVIESIWEVRQGHKSDVGL